MQRNNFVYSAGGLCVSVFREMELLLACGHREVRHYLSLSVTVQDRTRLETQWQLKNREDSQKPVLGLEFLYCFAEPLQLSSPCNKRGMPFTQSQRACSCVKYSKERWMQLEVQVISFFFLRQEKPNESRPPPMICSLCLLSHLKNWAGNLWELINNVQSNVIFSTEIHAHLQHNEFFFLLKI